MSNTLNTPRSSGLSMRNPMLRGAAAILLLLVTLTSAVSARHRNHHTEAAPGAFDYYLLSLSWSPAFCIDSPSSAECNGPRRFGFIVHGLWPQNEQGWPEHCGSGTEVPDAVVQGIADLMPARGLVYHEWLTHGTCSGLGPADFFALVRRAYGGLSIPGELTAPASAIEQPPAAIVAAFVHANPRLPVDSVVVTCSGQGASRLREVHLCMNRDLTPRACSPDAARALCKAATVLIPPLR